MNLLMGHIEFIMSHKGTLSRPIFPDFPRFSSIFPDFARFPPIFPDFPSFSPIFPVFPRFSPIFPVFPRFSPIFPVFPRFSPFFPDFPRFAKAWRQGFLALETGDWRLETAQPRGLPPGVGVGPSPPPGVWKILGRGTPWLNPQTHIFSLVEGSVQLAGGVS